MGADEQLGNSFYYWIFKYENYVKIKQLAGYARHRTRFEKDGFDALINEVKMEMKRISERNLGRDDRILSGKL